MRIPTDREKGAGAKRYMCYSTNPDRYLQHTKSDPSFCNQSVLFQKLIHHQIGINQNPIHYQISSVKKKSAYQKNVII